MAAYDEGIFTIDEIRSFIAHSGGKVTNLDLVRRFKDHLKDPVTGERAKVLFKEFVNQLAYVKVEGTEKFLILKEDLHLPPLTIPVPQPISAPPKKYKPRIEETHVTQSTFSEPPTESDKENVRSIEGYDIPPPNDENSDTIVVEKEKLQSEKLENEKVNENDKFVVEVEAAPLHLKEEVLTPPEQKGLVKEQAQRIQKIVNDSVVNLRSVVGSTATTRPRRENRFDNKVCDDDDTNSVVSLDPKAREWLVRSSSCDYHSMVRMLREEPRLAKLQDFTSGYTALHWAAKHGNLDVIKLIAGTYKVNPNAKSHGGYTALHLAALNNRRKVYDLLTDIYGADERIRDNAGRKPSWYYTAKLNRDGVLTNQTNKEQQPLHPAAPSPARHSSSYSSGRAKHFFRNEYGRGSTKQSLKAKRINPNDIKRSNSQRDLVDLVQNQLELDPRSINDKARYQMDLEGAYRRTSNN